jgi:hypothetical protein
MRVGSSESGKRTQLSGRERLGRWTYRQLGRRTALAMETKMELTDVVWAENK